VNHYQYVPNPTGWVDPLGLNTCLGREAQDLGKIGDSTAGVKVDLGEPATPASIGYGPNDPPVRIQGDWSESDLKQALLGHPPRGLGSPDLHHADQMPGSAIHEIIPAEHRGNKLLHPNRYNQGVTLEMRDSDRKLHWWYRAREQGADQRLPEWIYDNRGGN